MKVQIENEIEKGQIVTRICDFFRFCAPKSDNVNIKDVIKEICVARLCKLIGLSTYNHKSDFFDFFASIMGEAVCNVLKIKVHIANDNLRLIKYDHTNLISEVESYLINESVEEAFLDAFDLADRFKYIIPQLKKV